MSVVNDGDDDDDDQPSHFHSTNLGGELAMANQRPNVGDDEGGLPRHAFASTAGSGLPRIGSAPPSPTSSLPASTAAQHLLLSPDGSSQVHVLVNVHARPGSSGGGEDGDSASDPDYGTDDEHDHETDIESGALLANRDPRHGMLVPDSQRAWDDSDEDEPQVLALEHEDDQYYHGGGGAASGDGRFSGTSGEGDHLSRQRRRRGGQQRVAPDLMPIPILTSQQRRSCWRFLTNPPTQNSLSAPAVTLNLFAGSLHPAVLLSMPYYFERTGLALGLIGLLGVGFLSGVGGGLWIVLARYVGRNDDDDVVGSADDVAAADRALLARTEHGHASRKRAKKTAQYGEGGNMTTLEGVTGAALGRHTVWKRTLGRTISGALLAAYATGTAFLAYFALADLLLQVLLHYSPRGVPTHDRLFVTAVVGGLLTAPLVIFPLAKRTLIRFSTACAVIFYPILLTALLVKIYTMDTDTRLPPVHVNGLNAQPLHPPSIWAPYSLLPVLTLSSSPLQIIQHNRSLRRIGMSRSNTKAFMAAQAGQVLLVAGIGVAFGIGVGTQGMGKRLGIALTHPNLMASLPMDDHLFNTARVCFVLLLATHFALCLVTARSSWGRLLRLYHLNPFRYRRGAQQRKEGGGNEGRSAGAGAASSSGPASSSRPGWARPRPGTSSHEAGPPTGQPPTSLRHPPIPRSPSFPHQHAGSFPAPKRKVPRQWNRLSRNALGGLILWFACAGTAYLSGVGGLRRSRNEKAGEEARFVRSAEMVGLLGAAVGFVLPGLVWVVLFHVRRPRAILLAGSLGVQVAAVAQELGNRAGAWLRGLSVARREAMERERRRRLAGGEASRGSGFFGSLTGGGQRVHRQDTEERRGLLADANASDGDDDEHGGGATMATRVQGRRRGGLDDVALPRSISHDDDGIEADDEGPGGGVRPSGAHGDPDPLAVLLASKERQLQRRRRGRRLYQDLLVCAAVLPFGTALVVLGALELSRGGY